MDRSPLLHEALVKKVKTRQGWVYNLRSPKGPPPAEDPRVTELLYTAAQHFDFSPLFAGDQEQARQVSRDFLAHVRGLAADAGIENEVAERLKVLLPFLRQSFLVFRQMLEAGIRGSK